MLKEAIKMTIVCMISFSKNSRRYSSSDRKHISGCIGWGVERSKKGWITWADDRNVHCFDCGTGFTAIYIQQSLPSYTFKMP